MGKMKNKNGVRYLDFIFTVFGVKGCKVQEGRQGTGHGGIYGTGRQIERGERAKHFHRLYSEIKG